MKIAVIGRQFTDSLAHNCSYTLDKMGHTVLNVDERDVGYLKFFQQRFPRVFGILSQHPRFELWRSSLVTNRIVAFRPDLVLSTFTDFHPEAVLALRKACDSTTKIVFCYPDAIANLGRMLPIAAEYDAWFFKDQVAVELFRNKLDLNAYYLPEACNPDWHKPVSLSIRDIQHYGCDLTIAGNMYYYRARLLESLDKYDLKIWGNFAEWIDSPIRKFYQHEYVAGIKKAKAFRAAKIVINTLHPTEVSGATARIFETAGCGAFQIVEWRPAIDELFRPEQEMVSFKTRDELINKIDYYLQHPDEREAIAQAAMQRAHYEHTYAHRLTTIINCVYHSSKSNYVKI